MSISLECPGCAKKLKAKEEIAGRRVKCPACGQLVLIPVASPTPQPKVTAASPTSQAKAPSSSPARPPTDNRQPLAAASPVSKKKRTLWPWYAAGGTAATVVIAFGLYFWNTLGKADAPAKNAMAAAVTQPKPQLGPEVSKTQSQPKSKSGPKRSKAQPAPKPKPEPEEPKPQSAPKPQPAPEGSNSQTEFNPQPEPKALKIYDTSRLTFPVNPDRELDFAKPDVVVFSPDGKRLITMGANEAKETIIIAWDTTTWEKVREAVLQNGASQAAFTPDQKRLVLASGDNEKLSLLDPATLQVQNLLTAPGTVISFSIAPDGKSIATIASSDWKIQLWDLATLVMSRTFSEPADLSTSILHSPDGKYLVSAGKRLVLWNLTTGLPEKVLSRDEDGFAFLCAAFSPDSTQLAVSCNDSRIRLWELVSGQEQQSLEASQANVFAVRFSADGRSLLTRSIKGFDRSDRTQVFFALAEGSHLCLWNLATRTNVQFTSDVSIFKTHSFAFSPDGKTIAATRNKSIGVWTGTENK